MAKKKDNSRAQQVRLGEVPILIITRFSFLGLSGWQGDASRDAELLFEPARVNQRLDLMRAITLPSLSAQGDHGFHHLIMTSSQLPDWAMQKLQKICEEAYGDETRYTIYPRPPARARRELRRFMNSKFGERTVVQVVVDDDDGLSTDFIANLRRDLISLEEDNPEIQQNMPYFISYALGYGLSLRDGKDPKIYSHRFPYINLGLTMISTANGPNILSISHKKDPPRTGVRLIEAQTSFVRCLHDFNDSRVRPTGKWEKILDWQKNPDLQGRFEYLGASDAPWRTAAE